MCSFWKLVTNSSGRPSPSQSSASTPMLDCAMPALVERGARGLGGILERSVSLVEEEEVRVHVVGDVEVDPAVAVEVGGDDAEAVAVGAADARLVGHVGESSVAVVAVEDVFDRPDVPRRAEERDPVVAAAMGIAGIDPIAVVGDVDVQVAVVVVVEHRPARGPVRPVDPGGDG